MKTNSPAMKKRFEKLKPLAERVAAGCGQSVLLMQEEKNFARWMSRDNDILNYFAGDIGSVSKVLWESLENLRRTKADALYTVLLFALTHTRFSSEEAKKLWDELIVHKYFMSEKMGRNVGIKVAALDFFDNQSGRIKDLQLLPEQDLDCLLLFVNEDGLTGLFNHRFFQERLREEVLRCQRYNRTFSLLFMDLDHFKAYNDHFGHMKGDMLLREIAQFLKACGREADTVARYGGDEFALILPETNAREARGYAERIRLGFLEKEFGHKLPDPLPSVTLSIGVATYGTDGFSAEEIIEVADAALYGAKGAGRNCIQQGRPMLTDPSALRKKSSGTRPKKRTVTSKPSAPATPGSRRKPAAPPKQPNL